MVYKREAELLKRSSWPVCERLAENLAANGPEAADALIFACNSRTHHVRSAALKALNRIAPDKARALAGSMLADRAYEVRETAANVLGVPVPS